jgi:DNA-binding CsgD family transcriptional regulator
MLAQPSQANRFRYTVKSAHSAQNFVNLALLEAAIESCIDGILVLTEQGKWVQINQTAHRLFDRFSSNPDETNRLLQQIWQVCSSLIQSRQDFQAPVVIESELEIEPSTILRIRAKWFTVDETAHPYVLVILEDRSQSIQNLALAEVDRYQLTPREAEVWFLYRANHSYKAIAQTLNISINTVKKHMKNIHAKRLSGYEMHS